MQKSIIIGLAFVLLAGFSYGTVVGHYEVFPFEILSLTKQIISGSDQNISEDRLQISQKISKISEHITINNFEDIQQKRKQLIEYIWVNESFPSNKLPQSFQQNIIDPIFSDMVNLSQIDSFTVVMDYGMDSTSYLFIPKESNNKLVIFHQGRATQANSDPNSHTFNRDKEIIQNFLNHNYAVLIFSMVGKGMNNEPIIELERFGTVTLNSHNHFELLESENFHPIKFFIEPVIITLNQVEKNYLFNSISMVGLSQGGGWSAVVIPAIDPRITESYSVAGSFPIWMSSSPSNFGDYEQTIPEFYKIANYEELYIMGAYGEGRKLVLFYNEFDPCCFSGHIYKQFPFKTIIQERLKILEGEFDVIIDEGQDKHVISDFTLNQIFSSLESKL